MVLVGGFNPPLRKPKHVSWAYSSKYMNELKMFQSTNQDRNSWGHTWEYYDQNGVSEHEINKVYPCIPPFHVHCMAMQCNAVIWCIKFSGSRISRIYCCIVMH